MRTTSGVWLPGCIPVGCFDSCVITGLTSFFERGNITYVACPTIVRRKKNVSQKRLVFTFWPHLKYLSRESNYLLSVIFEEIEKLLERTQLSVVKDQLLVVSRALKVVNDFNKTSLNLFDCVKTFQNIQILLHRNSWHKHPKI